MNQKIVDMMRPKFFKALCDPNRIAMLAWLCGCKSPSSVTEAAKCCNVDLSVVSRHLTLMKEAGIVHSQKQGKEVRYSVSPGLADHLRKLADMIDEENCSIQNN